MHEVDMGKEGEWKEKEKEKEKENRTGRNAPGNRKGRGWILKNGARVDTDVGGMRALVCTHAVYTRTQGCGRNGSA